MINLQNESVNNLRDKYFEMQRSKYFYLSLTLATISIFIVFAIRPTIIQAIEAYKNLQELKHLESILVQKEERLEVVRTKIENNKETVSLLSKAIPDDTNESIFLSNLNESAFKKQVILDGISFMQKTPEKNQGTIDSTDSYQSLEFTLSFDAKYTDLQLFISDINNYLRLTQITNISIEQNASLKGARVKGKLTGRIFYK